MRRLSDGWMDARWWCVDGFKLGVGWMQVGCVYGCKVGGWMDVRWVGGWGGGRWMDSRIASWIQNFH